MSIESIEREFKEKVCDRIRLVSEGMNRYQVFTPFQFRGRRSSSHRSQAREFPLAPFG